MDQVTSFIAMWWLYIMERIIHEKSWQKVKSEELKYILSDTYRCKAQDQASTLYVATPLCQ